MRTPRFLLCWAVLMLVGACGPAQTPEAAAPPARVQPASCPEQVDEIRRRLRAEREELRRIIREVDAVARDEQERERAQQKTLSILPPSLDHKSLKKRLSELASQCGGTLGQAEPHQRAGRLAGALALRAKFAAGGSTELSCWMRALAGAKIMFDAEESRATVDRRGAAAATQILVTWRLKEVIQGQRTQRPGPIPVCAQAGVKPLHDQIQREAAAADPRVPGLLARWKARRRQLRALDAVQQRVKRFRAITLLATAALDAGLAPGEIKLTGGRLEISGSVPSPKARQRLLQLKASPGLELVVRDITVIPPPPVVDPQTLAPWKLAGRARPRRGRKVTVHAHGADGDLLQAKLSRPPRAVLVRSGRGIRVTGRVVAPRPGKALAALLRAYPALAKDATIPRSRSFRGVKVDLDFQRVEGAALLRLLGDVGQVRLVASGKLPAVIVGARSVPWDAAVQALADRSGLGLVRISTVWYLLPPGTPPPPVPASQPEVKKPPPPRLRPDLRQRRLTATICGPRGSLALFEDPAGGRPAWLSDGRQRRSDDRVEIKPGRVVITHDQGYGPKPPQVYQFRAK